MSVLTIARNIGACRLRVPGERGFFLWGPSHVIRGLCCRDIPSPMIKVFKPIAPTMHAGRENPHLRSASTARARRMLALPQDLQRVCPAPRWLGRRIRGITDTRSIHQTLHLATAVHSGAIDATLAGTRRLFRRRAGKSAGLVLLLHRNAPTQCAAELVICGRRARLLEGFRRTVAGQTQAALGLRNTANVSPSRRHCQHLRTTIPHRAARAPPRAGRSDAPRAAPRS